MAVQSIFNHLIVKVGVNHHKREVNHPKNRSKNSKMRKLKFEED